VTVAPLAVFPGMMAGAVYMAIGLAWMPRLAWIGFAIFVLSVAAYLFAGPSLLYWMAATGGGGLIVSGLWLRAA
jgi:F0F1-type ATP synthase membrane subunit a